MRKNKFIALIHGLSIIFFLFSQGIAAENKEFPVSPPQIPAQKWRIGYVEGGPWWDYQSILKAFIEGLAEAGWIEKRPFPETKDGQETQTLWRWLSTDVRSNYLEFPADAYWSAGWDDQVRRRNKESLLTRLSTQKDIDFMLAFGTHAGLDLANDRHAVPTMVFSTSNPIQAGIIKSAEDSGLDHLHAQVDPKREERRIRLFYDIVKFKKLGVVLENTPTGRTYADIDTISRLGRELGFEAVECHAPDEIPNIELRDQKTLECFQKLAPQIDAMFLVEHTGINRNALPSLLKPMFEYNVATFAQAKLEFVKYGVLMGLDSVDFRRLGRFHAEIFGRILNGAKPRDLSQIFEERLEMVINLETARKIGFHFPIEAMAGAFNIYEKIENSE
jgi:ABC-type uncharacterized transport system substrate-binding protein